MTNPQLQSVGPHPDVATLLVSALLWSAPASAVDVLRLVADDDLADPALAAVLAAVRVLVDADTPPAPQLVADELRRTGRFRGNVPDRIRAATTAGAAPQAVRGYAAATVAEALRRRVESAGHALATAAPHAAEAELAPLVAAAAAHVADTARRLELLRGESL